MSNIFRNVSQAVARMGEVGRTDGQLLESFLRERDETAFEALVRRHGPMVLGVCRRVTGHAQDAEEAFQAAFLVLARKAASVRPREQLARWLYGVAYKTALKARVAAARRRTRERQVPAMPQPQARPEPSDELCPVLDRELSRLPEKYRLPLVLCALEGRTYREAARQLGLSEGALSVRLVRAKVKLAARLSRLGLGLAAGSLSAVLAADAAASVPAPLVSSTVRGAAMFAAGRTAADTIPTRVMALAKEVLGAMRLAQLKAAAVVAVAVLGAGLAAGGLAYRSGHSENPGVPLVADVAPGAPREEGERGAKPPPREEGEVPRKRGPYGFVILGPTLKGGKVVFDLEYGRSVTGLVRFIVEDSDGKKLWEVEASGQTAIKQITYGVVPADPRYSLQQQKYPAGGNPPQDIRGRTVRVTAHYRFTVPLGPGVEIYVITVRVPEK
jgi:RNA polymerase sigma factor (sigma-70 family)